MMKYYAIIDTNVLVSAMLKTDSIPGKVAAEAMYGDIIPILNDDIIAEYKEVLRRPKFKFEERAINVFLDELQRRAIYVDAGIIYDTLPDSKDIVFYAVLMEKSKSDEAYLITGNIKHFPNKNIYSNSKRNVRYITGRQRVTNTQNPKFDCKL